MKVALLRYFKGPELALVVKRFREKYVIPIGTANDNPILDSRIYEVEYTDRHQDALAANSIAENLFAQVDNEGHHSVLMQDIVDHRVNRREVTKENAFII